MRHSALIIHNCKARQSLSDFSLMAAWEAYWRELGDERPWDMSKRVKYATVHHVRSRENCSLELNYFVQ